MFIFITFPTISTYNNETLKNPSDDLFSVNRIDKIETAIFFRTVFSKLKRGHSDIIQL